MDKLEERGLLIEEEVRFMISHKVFTMEYCQLYDHYQSIDIVHHIIKKCYNLSLKVLAYLEIAKTYSVNIMDINTDKEIDDEIKYLMSYKFPIHRYGEMFNYFESRKEIRNMAKRCYNLGIALDQYIAMCDLFQKND